VQVDTLRPIRGVPTQVALRKHKGMDAPAYACGSVEGPMIVILRPK
jgi:hypothetical protein